MRRHGMGRNASNNERSSAGRTSPEVVDAPKKRLQPSCQVSVDFRPKVWRGTVAEPTKRIQSIDWDRVSEYLLGRSTLIGIASLMLLMISGYATWHGMSDFIVGLSATPTDTQ